MIWRGFIAAALLAVAALSLFARRERPDELPSIKTAPPPPQPGYFMTGARIVQTGPDGTPLYRIDAARIQQNPQDLTVRMEDLRLDYNPRQPPAQGGPRAHSATPQWTLTARSGRMPEDAGTIELAEGVQIRGRPPVKNAAPALIRTERLSVDMQAELARTDQRVDILWGERQLSAIGLTADLKAGRVKLESAVHGRFVR